MSTPTAIPSIPADFCPAFTPVELHDRELWVKRDDLWSLGGATGAKARALAAIAAGATGIISVGARVSPQLERAALIARALGIGARLHTGGGHSTPQLDTALRAGATILRHRPGRLSVLRARYRADAEAHAPAGWVGVPWGMEHPVYLDQVAEQAAHLPPHGYRRLVVPVGSGMSLAGILAGLTLHIPVVGVRVGADPAPVLDRHAAGWRDRVELVSSPEPYEKLLPGRWGEHQVLLVDERYEAKCLPFLRRGDLLWCVGKSVSAA